MLTHPDPTNRSALEFNYNAAETMKEICAPLRNLGIGPFTYCRIFNDGRRLYLCSEAGWVENYINNKFQDNLDHLEYYVPQEGTKYSFWSGFKKNKVLNSIYDFGWWHGFAVYGTYEDYIECVDFGADRGNYKMTDFFINNIEFLEDFIRDFKEKYAHLIDPTDQSKLMIPKQWVPFEKIKRNSFIEDSKIKNFVAQTKIGH